MPKAARSSPRISRFERRSESDRLFLRREILSRIASVV
jgi:hypothetical protein